MDNLWKTFSLVLIGVIVGAAITSTNSGLSTAYLKEQSVKSVVLIYENKAYCVTLMGGYE